MGMREDNLELGAGIGAPDAKLRDEPRRRPAERAVDGAAWDAINSDVAKKARQESVERAKANATSDEVVIAEYPPIMMSWPVPSACELAHHGEHLHEFQLDGDAGAELVRIVNLLHEKMGDETFAGPVRITPREIATRAEINAKHVNHLLRFLVHAAGPLFREKLSKATKAEKAELGALIASTSSPHRESKLQRVEREEKEQLAAEATRNRDEAKRVEKLRARAAGELEAEEAQARDELIEDRVRELGGGGGE